MVSVLSARAESPGHRVTYSETSLVDHLYKRTTSVNGPLLSRPTKVNRILNSLNGPPLYSDLDHFNLARRSENLPNRTASAHLTYPRTAIFKQKQSDWHARAGNFPPAKNSTPAIANQGRGFAAIIDRPPDLMGIGS